MDQRIIDPEGALERRNHWEKTSHALLVGTILHVLYAEADKTLAGVAAFLSDPKRPIESTLAAMMKTAHLGEAGPHPVIASAARELLNKSDNERSGVLSTAMSFLGLYRDPVVAKVTRRCDWRIADIRSDDKGTTFEIISPKGDRNGAYCVNLLGHQNARNAALAIALAAELGLSREELDQGLQRCRPASMRMEMQTLGDVRIINDAYNSNPDSLLAALETMGSFPVGGKRIAVLGDMAELGQASESAHVEAGQLAARLGLNGLVTVGQWADTTVRAAQEAGLANVAAFDDVTMAGKALAKKLEPGDAVLIKGSRAAKMEGIIEVLSEAMNT